jgi:hypothetical protein
VKKGVFFLILGIVSIFIVACNTNQVVIKDEAKAPSGAEATKKDEMKIPFPDGASETGDGKLTIQTADGEAADGDIPVLMLGEDDLTVQTGFTIENFADDKDVFIFVNKRWLQTEHGGKMFQGTLALEKDPSMLKPGTYTVTAVQYEGNDPVHGKVIEFHQAKFAVKAGQ